MLAVLWDSSRRCAQHGMAAASPSPHPPSTEGAEAVLPCQPADSLLPSSGLAGIVRSNGLQLGKEKGLSPPSSLSLSLHCH